MKHQLVACCLVAITASVSAATVQRKPLQPGCVIGLTTDLPKKNEPVLFVRDYDGSLSFAMPETSGKIASIGLRTGEEVVVACPGHRNELRATGEDASRGSCKGRATLTLSGKDVETEHLDCTGRVAASLVNTGKSCAQGQGTLIQLGFQVEKWHPLAETCHNIGQSLSYFTTHTVNGPNLAGKVNQAFRPGFSRGDKIFFAGFNPEEAYNQNNQHEVLERTLGKKSAQKYLQAKKAFFMARGHLAPDADFLFGSWQLLTYFYINVAPQWQSINAGSWLGVENNVRKVASALGADLDVATGTYGILSLPDDQGTPKEIYLADGGRLPAPELYWKVLHNPQDDSCIALVSTNNPFLESPPRPICRDVCESNGWPLLQSDLSKGYVYCCSYADFKRAVSYAPNFKCKSELQFRK